MTFSVAHMEAHARQTLAYGGPSRDQAERLIPSAQFILALVERLTTAERQRGELIKLAERAADAAEASQRNFDRLYRLAEAQANRPTARREETA